MRERRSVRERYSGAPMRRPLAKSSDVVLCGAGGLAQALAPALGKSGLRLTLWSRKPAQARALARRTALARAEPELEVALLSAPIVLLAVSDPALRDMTRRIALTKLVGRGSVVLHHSGFHGAQVLAVLQRQGAAVGSLHPLFAFRRTAKLADIQGAWFTTEGDPRARAAARNLVRAFGGRELALGSSASKARYHLGAALLANGTVGLFELALFELERAGAGRKAARAALASLLASTARNLREAEPSAALTGPIARGDAELVRGHLAIARASSAEVYRALAPVLLRLAREAGLSAHDARSIERALARPRPRPHARSRTRSQARKRSSPRED